MQIVTIEKISELINVKRGTLYSWAQYGQIPSIKLNGVLRFDMDEVEKWIEESKLETKIPQNKPRKAGRNQNIESLVKKVIDDVNGKRYNTPNGKPG